MCAEWLIILKIQSLTVIISERTLLDSVNIVDGTKEDCVFIINTPESPDKIKEKLDLNGRKVFTLNANQIAQDVIGRPIPNTVMLGALIKATKLMKMETLLKGLEKKFSHKFTKNVIDKNMEAVKRAYEEVTGEWVKKIGMKYQ